MITASISCNLRPEGKVRFTVAIQISNDRKRIPVSYRLIYFLIYNVQRSLRFPIFLARLRTEGRQETNQNILRSL